jgi:hypothetical protein
MFLLALQLTNVRPYYVGTVWLSLVTLVDLLLQEVLGLTIEFGSWGVLGWGEGGLLYCNYCNKKK